MQLHNLTPKTKSKYKKRIGRGGKRGTFSGRGTKGQHARAGAKFHPQERNIIKKIPKLRGSKFKGYHIQPMIINFGALEKKFQEGATVSPETLKKIGLIDKVKGKLPSVKILGGGNLKKKFMFKNVLFSKSLETKLK